MTKIKIVGALIFSLSIILAMLFGYISKQRAMNSDLLNSINMQKAFTQEISKNIFYLYKHQDTSYKELDNYIKKFVERMNNKEKNFSEISCKKIEKQNRLIIKQWNEFYRTVQKFRDQSRVTTAYSNIILEKTVSDIYNKNLMLIISLNSLIELHKLYFDNQLQNYKTLQYALFFLLISLLIYLFTQLKAVISFIQKFINTSQSIITKSTIKDLKPIEVDNNSADVLKASNNFNLLVQNINSSIENSATSIEHSVKSLELVENNIEDLLDLVVIMEESDAMDKDLTKKEDALIQSLEELTTSAQQLRALKTDLDELISHYHSNNS